MYHLSAQFPGPTTPRDFITLLLTSSSALGRSATASSESNLLPHASDPDRDHSALAPRHFVVISKPCSHPDCTARDGFVRGEYESIECIREIPLVPPPRASSITGRRHSNTASLGKEAALGSISKARAFPAKPDLIRDVGNKSESDLTSRSTSSGAHMNALATERRRGQTISFVEPDQDKATTNSGPTREETSSAPDDCELNPVEWIMITRSDPGGSVPRWMVERGTPAGIVADAVRFLDWATTLEDRPEPDGRGEVDPGRAPSLERMFSRDLQALDMNGHLWGFQSNPEGEAMDAQSDGKITVREPGVARTLDAIAGQEKADAITVKSNPNATHPSPPKSRFTQEPAKPRPTRESLSDDDGSVHDSLSSGSASFITASSKDHDFDDPADEVVSVGPDARSSQTAASAVAGDLAHPSRSTTVGDVKQLVRLDERKRKIEEKLATARSKILGAVSSPGDLSPKRSATLAKTEERHRKEMEKHEQKYQAHLQKMELKREREKRKEEGKWRKQQDKDERTRWSREKEDLQRQVETVIHEKEELMGQVGELQRQNTLLTASLGKVDPRSLTEILSGGRPPTSMTTTAEVKATSVDEL